jgi:hypothetical protein
MGKISERNGGTPIRASQSIIAMNTSCIGFSSPFKGQLLAFKTRLNQTLSSPIVTGNSRAWHRPGRTFFAPG